MRYFIENEQFGYSSHEDEYPLMLLIDFSLFYTLLFPISLEDSFLIIKR